MVASLAADGCLFGFVRKQVGMQLRTYVWVCVPTSFSVRFSPLIRGIKGVS